MKKLMVIALIGVASLAACSGGVEDQSDGATSTSTAAPESPENESDEASAVEDSGSGSAAEDADRAFGETFTYEYGHSVSVTQPETFMPSATSLNGGEPDFVTFRVTVVNGSAGDVIPADISVTVGSGDGEGGEVSDPDAGISGPPRDAVAPGGEAAWPLAFGVLDGGDLLVRVQRGTDAEPVSFGG